MTELRRNGTVHTAVCGALAAAALACVPATAHEVTDASRTAYETPPTSNAGSTPTQPATRDDAPADRASTSGTSSASTGTASSGGAAYTATSETDANRGSDAVEADQSNRSPPSGGQRSDVVWYVVPVTLQAQGDQMGKGCWVRLYSGDEFEGRYVSIVGPAQLREMSSPYGTGMNNWESAVVGPNATVTTYDDEGFRSRNATLRAGQRYPDLDDSKLGLFDDIESIKVDCSSQSQQGGSRTGS